MRPRCPDCRRRDWSVNHSADRLTCKNCGATYTEEAVEDRQEGW